MLRLALLSSLARQGPSEPEHVGCGSPDEHTHPENIRLMVRMDEDSCLNPFKMGTLLLEPPNPGLQIYLALSFIDRRGKDPQLRLEFHRRPCNGMTQQKVGPVTV